MLEDRYEQLKERIAELELQLGNKNTELEIEGSLDLQRIEASATVERIVFVGTHFVEFAESVPPTIRSSILNLLLLAQLAANHKTQDSGSWTAKAENWYNYFGEVLSNIGLIASLIKGYEPIKGAQPNKALSEIINVMATALGPVASCKSIILALLVGHLRIDTEQPGIQAFQTLQKDALGSGSGKFEIFYINPTEDGNYRIAMHGFQYDSLAAPEGILFSAAETNQINLFHSQAEFLANTAVFETLSDAIAAKVSAHQDLFIFNII